MYLVNNGSQHAQVLLDLLLLGVHAHKIVQRGVAVVIYSEYASHGNCLNKKIKNNNKSEVGFKASK